MNANYIILALLAVAVLTGGCLDMTERSKEDPGPMQDSTLTKDSRIVTTPPRVQPSLNVYGKLVGLDEVGGVLTFKIMPEFVNWEKNTTYVEIEARISRPDLVEGDSYVFHFMGPSRGSGPWDMAYFSGNLTEYRINGAMYHVNDLARDQMMPKEEQGDDSGMGPGGMKGMRIVTTPINAGEPTSLEILLINKQDTGITYRITDAGIVNEEASQFYGPWWQLPPYEERIENAMIDECEVYFDPSESVIAAGSNKTLTFNVECPDGVDITRTYEICDNFEEGQNCRTETADRTDNLMLWGEIEFTDELGNVHTFPEKGVLKQFLELR